MTNEKKANTEWIVETFDYEMNEVIEEIFFDPKEAMDAYDKYVSDGIELVSIRRVPASVQLKIDWLQTQQH